MIRAPTINRYIYIVERGAQTATMPNHKYTQTIYIETIRMGTNNNYVGKTRKVTVFNTVYLNQSWPARS